MAVKKKKRASKASSAKRKPSRPVDIENDSGFIDRPLVMHGLIWTVLFVFSALFMYIDSKNIAAVKMQQCLGGLFGRISYLIPIMWGGTLLYLIYFKSVARLWIKFGLAIAGIVDICSIVGAFAKYGTEDAFDICSAHMSGGGLIGVAIGGAMTGFMGKIATVLVLLILLIAIICVMTKFNILPYIRFGIRRLCGMSTEAAVKVRDKYSERERQLRDRMEEEDRRYSEHVQKVKENGYKRLTYEKTADEDELPQSLSERIKERRGMKNPASIDIANGFAHELETSSVSGVFDDAVSKQELYDMKFAIPGEAQEAEEIIEPEPQPKEETAVEDVFADFEINEMTSEPAVKKDKLREKKLTSDEKEEFKAELDAASEITEHVPYEFPPLDLLDIPKNVSNDKRQELYRKAEQLISVLDNFGVKAKPVQVTQGPTVTRYEIQPQSGVKLSKIVGLADDIALNLAVSTVLIAPVPGKAATVGVEIPNNNVTPVGIRDLLASPEFKTAKSKLTVCLGKDIGGNVVVGDIAKWPHALIAGATGSGKSVCINTIITSILYKADPNEVKLIMVDPKQVELGVYNGIPHLLIPVVTEAKKAAGALNWAVQEMMHRYELFKETGVRKLEGYNKLMEKTGGEKIPQLVIIIDELADLMMVAAKEVEDYICRLAQLARAAGIYLIIATQRPSVDVITGLIKANVPSRIAFFVSSQVDSRTIIDKSGAEKLLGMGDMLYFPAGARSTTRVQGAFVSDGEVERIVEYIKETSPDTHYREDLADHIERIEFGENGVTPDKDDDGDPLLSEAIQLAVELGKISTSMVQRRLSVGYSRAGRIIDQMEARGIISAANGSKPRDVLISHADFSTSPIANDIADEDE